jgi:regulator of nucleoside diphosphate kinase
MNTVENKNKLVLKKRDYELMLKYVHTHLHPLSKEHKNAEQLFGELQDAEVYDDGADIPSTVVQLYSEVEVEEQGSRRKVKFKIVPPSEANMSQQRLSVFAPLSVAVMGYCQGQEVSWEMPAGPKKFLIRKVKND